MYTPDSNRYNQSEGFYRRCGRSGVLLPRVSLGFWHNFGAVDPLERSRAITHYAFDHGITHFDLANNYGPPYGSAETTLGTLMQQDFAPHRHELFISTKAGYDMWPGPYGNWGSRKYLITSLDQSLERMHLDYVDLFYSHRYDPNTPLEETLQALVDVVHAGKALYVGISRWPIEATKLAVGYLREQHVPLLAYQGKLNLISPEPVTSGLLSLLEREGVGFTGFSPLQQGLLTNRYLHGIPADSRMGHGRLRPELLTPELRAKLLQWSRVAQGLGISLAQLALAWVLQHRQVTTVIVGASRVEQLADDLNALSVGKLPEIEL